MSPKKIYVIAGEASGDLHGSNLIKNLKRESKEPLQIYGVGGDRIRETGALEFFDLAHFHVTGFSEALKRLPQYRKAARIILSSVQKVRPDLVVLIDNPGFNLHLAEKIHALGIPIIYYISPQIWAWAPKRIFKIKKTVAKVLVVFEFERKLYEEHGISVAWVGHPLKDLTAAVPAEEPRNEPLVTLLPGSRKGEVKILLPIFLKAACLIAKELPGASFALIKSPALPPAFYERFLAKEPVRPRLVEDGAYGVIKASDLAIACSGTATLECALLGTPVLISNKGSLLTYVLAKRLARVPFLGLPNIILGEKRFPELLQYDATPEKIAHEALKILKNKGLRQSLKEDSEKVSRRLGETGANKRAAQEVLKTL